MKVRLISAAVAIVIGVTVLFFLPEVAFYFAVAAVSGIAAFEMVRVVKHECCVPMQIGAVITAVITPLFCLLNRPMLATLLLLLFGVYVVILQVLHHTQAVSVTGYVFFVTFYVAVSFFCLCLLRSRDNGLLYVLLALLIPWLSDSSAYFAGTFFGKHKMCPAISPKKTWEGFFGGWICGTALTTGAVWLFCWLLTGRTDMMIFWQVAVTALVATPISVAGDLFASVVKRQYGIKDLGTIMPGHGGVMDRFDSVCLCAPIVLAFTQIFPLFL